MRYQGSKKKMAKVLKQIIEPMLSKDVAYVEPFCGGGNSLSEIETEGIKIASDINHYLYELWNAVKNGMITEQDKKLMSTLTQEQYLDMKKDCLEKGGRYPDYLLGYVGFSCSYGGGWWNGYAHYNPNKHEDHIMEAYRGFMKQVKDFKAIERTEFINVPYDQIEIPKGSFVYCDPPYQGTKKYVSEFDTEALWKWAEHMVHEGSTLMISEFSAPEDWVCIWSKDMQDGMGSNPKNRKVEKIFVHWSQEYLFAHVKALYKDAA